MSWRELFARSADSGVSFEEIRESLVRRRNARDPSPDGAPDGESNEDVKAEPSPARIVADADVLAADLLVGGDARDALDPVRAHSWVQLVASDPLLDDAAAVVAELADDGLAADWRDRLAAERVPVDHPAGDHPALASAYRGGAMHVLSFDEHLRSVKTGVTIRGHVETSVKHPGAFARLFDPESLYAAVEDGTYPGPDRDPRE